MNAIQFIKDHGVEKAREVVEGAPERATHLLNGEYVRVSDPRWILDGYVSISDLKRLVESVDIITKVGGIHEAIEEHTKWMHAPELHLYRIGESVERLKQAIADYEAIYSNDCEILDFPEDYTSPNCKKFDEQVK